MLYDLFQNSRIRRNESDGAHTRSVAQEARKTSRNTERDVEGLEDKVEALLMISEALWEIVKTSDKLDDEYLKQMIEQIDMRDGKLDGKVAKSPPTQCTSCSRTLQRGQNKCIYCGDVSEKGVFER